VAAVGTMAQVPTFRGVFTAKGHGLNHTFAKGGLVSLTVLFWCK